MIEKRKVFSVLNSLIILSILSVIAILNLTVGFIGLVIYFLAYNTYYFLKSGKSRITIYSWFYYIAILISGGSSLSMIVNNDFHRYSYIGLLLVFIVIMLINLGRKEYNIKMKFKITKNDFIKISIFLIMSILVIYLTPMIIPSLNFIQRPLAYVTFIAISLLILIYYDNKLVFIISSIITFLIYYIFYFNDFGRINIVTLFFIYLYIYINKYEIKHIKKLMILMILPGVALGSIMRGGSGDDIFGGTTSIFAPQTRFNQIVEKYNNKELDLFYGKTFYAAIVTPVPRDWWSNKPWNFNREMTYVFSPEKVVYGHSDVGSIFGEFLLNFSYLGLFLMPIIFVKLFNWFEKSIYKLSLRKRFDTRTFLFYVILILIISGMLDVYWGGPSTFMSRGGFRIIIFSFLYIVVMFYLRKIKIDRRM